PAGAVLVALAMAPLAIRTVKRRSLAASCQLPERPAGTNNVADAWADRPISPVGAISPLGGTSSRDHVRRHARAFTLGMAMLLLGGLGVCITQLSLVGPTGKNDPWLRLAVFVLSGIAWALGCLVSARALPMRWVAE